MPVKKKTTMRKNAEKRSVQEPSPVQDARNGLTGRVAAGVSAAAPPLGKGPSQMDSFEEGIRLFHARKFQQAREFFERAMGGPDRSVTHRAGLHARMCEQRLESAGLVLNTPEEHYNYAITLINSRDLGGAQKHLRAALDADATADHVLYALAACQSLGGDLQAACENLKRAIDLQPRNRLAARQDPDFAAMADLPVFIRLVHPDRKN
jgi:tetratricopeptide (TPR) repeat protein